MGVFSSFILGIAGFGAVFLLYRAIKHQPEIFAKEKLNKSFSTMGVLALVLIGIIGLVVVLLRN